MATSTAVDVGDPDRAALFTLKEVMGSLVVPSPHEGSDHNRFSDRFRIHRRSLI